MNFSLQAFSGKSFCNCWVHNGFVNIDNEKMSKSLKNFKTLRDIARGPDDARAYRMMVISAQYRSVSLLSYSFSIKIC